MNYDQATQEIFNEFKEDFINGALSIQPLTIKKAYTKRNLTFNFKKTQKFFKNENLLFAKLVNAPEPFNLFTQINKELVNNYFLYDESINFNPRLIHCI